MYLVNVYILFFLKMDGRNLSGTNTSFDYQAESLDGELNLSSSETFVNAATMLGIRPLWISDQNLIQQVRQALRGAAL